MRDEVFNSSVGKVEAQLISAYKVAAASITKDLTSLYKEITANEDYLLSDLYRYDRYYKVLNDINNNLFTLGEKEISILGEELKSFYITNSQLITDKLGKNYENLFDTS